MQILGIDPINRRDLSRLTKMPALAPGEILVCELIRIEGAPDFNKYYVIRSQAGVDAMNQACSSGQAMHSNFFACRDDSAIAVKI